MGHTYTNLLVHVIFSTKDRLPQLTPDLKPQLFPYMGGIVLEIGGRALAINGPQDHVYLLLILPPALALADGIRTIKANSSRWVHQKWPERGTFAWQTGYGAFSVSQSDADEVMKYIAGQEEHHRRVSFQEE